MALALLLHGQKSLFGFENGHIKQKAVHKVHVNSAKIWGIKMEIYLTAEVPMVINIDQLRVQRNRYQMTPSSIAVEAGSVGESRISLFFCTLLTKISLYYKP